MDILCRVSLPLTQEDLVEIKQRYFYIHELQTFQQYGVLLAKRLFTFQLVGFRPSYYLGRVLYAKCSIVLLFQCVLLDLLPVHRMWFRDHVALHTH